MRRVVIFLALSVIVASCFAPSVGFAFNVQYLMNPDDYASLYINGSHVMTFDSNGSGIVKGDLSLTEGWYTINIDYKNRGGTGALGFYWDAGIGDSSSYSILPEAYFRSQDANGQWITGLRADYYALNPDKTRGAFIETIYGEGPIAHGGNSYSYEGWSNGRSWATVGYSGIFEEVLTGQIYVGTSPSNQAVPTPIPAAAWLLGSGLIGLVTIRRGFRKN